MFICLHEGEREEKFGTRELLMRLFGGVRASVLCLSLAALCPEVGNIAALFCKFNLNLYIISQFSASLMRSLGKNNFIYNVRPL